ncbi:5-hydroxytryptamine receptor 3A-like [Aulostomus maculatus]
MIRLLVIVLIFLTDGASFKKVCTYQDVVDYLNLTTGNDMFTLTRPVLDFTRPTLVELDIFLYAILAVIEKTQTFIPYLWVTMMWYDERISWDPAQFCGISQISVPQYLLWKPDLLIYEMTQKDDSPQNPYIQVSNKGKVISENEMRVVSTCKMDVHKFPFDTQSCNITIGSGIYYAEEIRLAPFSNSSRATQYSQEVMKSQGEWEFLHLSISQANLTSDDRQWALLIYTLTMKRRPLLHVINFLLPILFFLILDLASYFISDYRGEKLGFKVTVLLAISVLLLILNEILPSMSNKTPLIATYCIVIFALMLLSLLETILVTYLVEKDLASQEKLGFREKWEANKRDEVKFDHSGTEERGQVRCSCIYKESSCGKQLELQPVSEEVNKGEQAGEAPALLLILEELKALKGTLSRHLGCKEERGSSVQWAARINGAFFVFYIVTVTLFLSHIFVEWNSV